MKVLMINSFCGLGSTGRICTDLADVLSEQGHEVKIAYGRENVPEKYQKYAVKIGTDLDVKLHGVKARLFDKAGFGSVGATKRFIEWVKAYDPDVIHLHNVHGYYINIEILFNYLKTCGKRILWTLHDCWAFTGHCTHFSYVKCNKWKKGCYECQQKTEYPASIICDKSKQNWIDKKRLFTGIKNMTITTPSKWLACMVKMSFLKEYPIVVINNGIDIQSFKPTESDFRLRYGLTDKKILLGVASSWNERKGLNDFIKLSKMIDSNYKIVLVGLSNKQMHNLPNTIIKIRKTNSIVELAEIYTAADVFINPSYEETMGLVTIEAIACGTPVVTSDCTAVPEFVPKSVGRIFHNRNIMLIYSLIKEVLAENYSKDSLQHYAATFEKNSKYMEYIKQYDSIDT